MTEMDEIAEQVQSVVEEALNRLAMELAEEERDADDGMTTPEYDAWMSTVLEVFAKIYQTKGPVQ